MQFRRGNVSISPMCPGSALGATINASPWQRFATLALAVALVACQVDDRPLSPPTTAGDGGSSNGGSGSSNGASGSGGSSNGGSSSGGSSDNGGGGSDSGGTTSASTSNTTNTSSGGASTDTAATAGNMSTSTNGDTSATCNAHGEMVIVDTGVPFAQVAYTYGDDVSTVCIESPEPGTVCAYGMGADSVKGDNQYGNWGAGLGFRLAAEDANGEVIEPFDAASRGIVGLRYNIDFFETGLSVRVGITRVNTTEVLFENFAFGPIADGVGDEADVADDTDVTAWFDDMSLASWADLDADPDTVDADLFPFEPSELHSVQLQVITRPGFSSTYDFCVSDFEWFDANGVAVSE